MPPMSKGFTDPRQPHSPARQHVWVAVNADSMDKRLYRITEVGLAEARRWLDQDPVEPPVLKHSIVLRLFFGHLTQPERLAAILNDYAASLVSCA